MPPFFPYGALQLRCWHNESLEITLLFLRPLWSCLHSPSSQTRKLFSGQWPKVLHVHAAEVGGEEGGDAGGGSWYFPTSWRVERQVQRRTGKSQQKGGSRGGGASDFFRCPTFRRGGGNSGFTHPSQGQALLFMQPGLEQTPGTLQRQATSHAQRSLVITGSAAWPRHSHVNTHTGRHFAWKPVINDLNQRKWCFSMCNVNVLKRTQQMHN